MALGLLARFISFSSDCWQKDRAFDWLGKDFALSWGMEKAIEIQNYSPNYSSEKNTGKNPEERTGESPGKNLSDFLSDLVSQPQADNRLLEWSGFLALENQEWELAENIFSCLLERRSKALDLAGLAKALRMQQRLKESEECYLESLNQITEPSVLLFTVYKALGDIYLLQKNFLQAEEYYNKASTLKSDGQGLLFSRAMMFLKEKNYPLAEQNFQNYLKNHLQSAKAWLGISLARQALGDTELALACLKKCLDIEPNNAQALKTYEKWSRPFVAPVCDLSFCA